MHDPHAHERWILAAELHNGVAQRLAAIGTLLQQVPPENNLALAARECRLALDEIRGLIDLLLHPLCEARPCNVVTALRREFDRSAPPGSSLCTDGTPIEMPGAAVDILSRLVREALCNAHEHSQAKSVKLDIRSCEQKFEVIVSDPGVGFHPDEEGQGHGVTLIEIGARLLGGRAEWHAPPPRGTRVRICVPLKEGRFEWPSRWPESDR